LISEQPKGSANKNNNNDLKTSFFIGSFSFYKRKFTKFRGIIVFCL